MAAPASLPEFSENDSVVLTENYWDLQLSELVSRRGQVNAKRGSLKKDATLSAEQREQVLEAFTAELFTAEERKILEVGQSNAEYHYLGSAKILAQIGKAFVEALRK